LTSRDVVITCYFTTAVDEQRACRWPADPARLIPLIDSCTDRNLVVIHDCFSLTDLPCENHRVPPLRESPYMARWAYQLWYLHEHPEIRFGWLVDSTDVRLLHDPFPAMQRHTLYCGYDWGSIGINRWLIEHSAAERDWISAHADWPLLNCGVVGGDPLSLTVVAQLIRDRWRVRGQREPLHEMVWFNQAAYAHPRLITAGVTTPYKRYATDHPSAWWAHK
jgi:hypothetical protein